MEIARLKPGITVAEAQAQIDAHNNAHAAEFPLAKEVVAAGFHTVVTPLHADHVASIRPILLLLQAGSLLLLLIGGVNLVNLLLIRASDRVKELAVRQSMGASRWDVVRQVATETLFAHCLWRIVRNCCRRGRRSSAGIIRGRSTAAWCELLFLMDV